VGRGRRGEIDQNRRYKDTEIYKDRKRGEREGGFEKRE